MLALPLVSNKKQQEKSTPFVVKSLLRWLVGTTLHAAYDVQLPQQC